MVLAVSRGLGIGARWLGQPLVMAEMVAGIVLGPSLLGWVLPHASELLFPSSSMNVLKMLSQLGLVLFMFLVGVELDPALLRGRGRASVLISHMSIVVPFALGLGAAWWLREDYAPSGVSFLPFGLFFGTAMSVTAFPVLARILTERGLTQSRVGSIAIACAAVDDVTAWCLLAVVVAIARANGIVAAAWTIGLSVTFSAFMLVLARPLLSRLGQRFVAETRVLAPGVVAATLFLLLLCSAVTEAIGIHALFGAFLFGAMLPKDLGLDKALASRLESVTLLLLLPLFRLQRLANALGLAARRRAVATDACHHRLGHFGQVRWQRPGGSLDRLLLARSQRHRRAHEHAWANGAHRAERRHGPGRHYPDPFHDARGHGAVHDFRYHAHSALGLPRPRDASRERRGRAQSELRRCSSSLVSRSLYGSEADGPAQPSRKR